MKLLKISVPLFAVLILTLGGCAPSTESPASGAESSMETGGEGGETSSEHHMDSDHHDSHGEGSSDETHDAHSGPHDKSASVEAGTYAYPLNTCPVTGAELGSMGEPIVETIDGREVRFCCSACPDKLRAKRGEYFEKMDSEIIALQRPDYPLDFCLVSGDELDGDHGKAIDVVADNRLFRVCCKSCIKDLKMDTGEFSAILDDALAGKEVARPEGSDTKHEGH